MKKITYLLAFLSITAIFTNFEYKDSLTVVETPNNDISYYMTDRDLQEFHTQKIKEELHLKELYKLTK